LVLFPINRQILSASNSLSSVGLAFEAASFLPGAWFQPDLSGLHQEIAAAFLDKG
jgi:hypothetical protein